MEKRNNNILINITIFIVLISISFLLLSPNMIYLSYNLFLAMIPLVISIIILKKDINILSKILLLILWILFFPNALYIFSDIIHLSNLEFYTREPYNIVYNMSFLPWYRLVVTVLSTIVGLVISYLSFQNVMKSLSIQRNTIKYFLSLILISALSGIAIFIGRFIRLNSWDAILNIAATLNEIKNAILSENIFLILLFSMLQFSIIVIVDLINTRR